MLLHKIDIARRQLDTAIVLFLGGGDICSVITLAAASEEILGNYHNGSWLINNPNNVFNWMFEEATAPDLPFKKKKEFSQNLVNRTKNGLKHADHPNEDNLSVNPEEAIFRLIHALMNYQMASNEPYSEPMSQFEVWVRANRPEYIKVEST